MHGYPIDVFGGRDGLENLPLVDLSRDGVLDQDAVDGRVLGKVADGSNGLGRRSGCREPYQPGVDTCLLAPGPLHFHIGHRGWVLTYQYRRQTGWPPRLVGEPVCSLCGLGQQCPRDGGTVHQASAGGCSCM